MAPPLDPDKMKAMMKNPWTSEMIKKDIELLKLAKRQKDEEVRFQKVGNMLQTLLGLLLCLVDMRLGTGKVNRRELEAQPSSRLGILPVAAFHGCSRP